MAQKYYFKCSECDYTSLNKFFLCPKCGKGMGEKINSSKATTKVKSKSSKKDLKIVTDYKTEITDYYTTHNKSLDELLSGGIAKDSITILAGPPGVGKSTLLLSIIDSLSKDKKCCYISAEETGNQIYNRYKRMNLKTEFILEHLTSVDEIIASTQDQEIIIIDSINTIFDENSDTVPGSVSQVKNCLFKLSLCF